MMRISLLVLALAAVCDGILPEIVHPAWDHVLEDHPVTGLTEPGRALVEVEQLQEAPQRNPQDATHPKDVDSVSPDPSNLPPDHHNESASDKVIDDESVHTSSVDLENHNVTTTTVPDSDLGNTIDHGCISDEDCGKGRYCLNVMHGSKCLPCKATDVSCTKDEECCADEQCVWGQCSPNATKGDAGSTCQYQTDCSPDLCCAFHRALLFPVCLAKPIERERCFGASNHLAELLSWDSQDKGPRKHCPCAGDLHCQQLGRGSMCLKGEDSSEEDMADTLYSEIDYII